MTNKVAESVSVSLAFDSKTKKAYPKWIVWKGRLYPVAKIGFHHTFSRGETLFHAFSVVSKTLFFKLILNTKNLHWYLEEVADGF